MTPMIDVVFQLIIFFIVTIKLDESVNPEIKLADSPHGPIIKEQDPRTLVVEVDRFGHITIHGASLNRAKFEEIMRYRRSRFGQFPVLIRGDKRTKHADIRSVMDSCAKVGLARISFAAIQEPSKKDRVFGGGGE